MQRVRWIIAAFLCALAAGSAAAQERKLEVVGLGDSDLERAAFHLGTSVDQVRQTRELLEKATDLVLQHDLDSSWPDLITIGWLWRRAHPAKAPSVVGNLMVKLTATARETPDRATYEWCATQAHALLQNLYRDPAKLAEFLEQWPERKDLDGETDDAMAGLTAQLERQRLLKTAEADPAGAAELLRNRPFEGSGQLTAEVARKLDSQGAGEEARRLLAERLTALASAPDSPEITMEFLSLMNGVSYWQPELLIPALRIFNSREWALPPQWQAVGGMQLENDLGLVQLTAKEAVAYSLLRNLQENPQTVLRALEQLPSLKAKLDRLGGFDKAGRADVIAPDETGKPRRFNVSGENREFPAFLYRWGEAAGRPSEVRRRLVASWPSGFDWPLLSTVQHHCVEDPAFSRVGLQLVKERYLENEDPDFRRTRLPRLLQAFRHCEGRADQDLIELGFQIVDEDKDAASEETPSNPFRVSPTGLEHTLLVEWSRLDFDTASEYVRQLEEPAEKFRVYVAMAEGRIGK